MLSRSNGIPAGPANDQNAPSGLDRDAREGVWVLRQRRVCPTAARPMTAVQHRLLGPEPLLHERVPRSIGAHFRERVVHGIPQVRTALVERQAELLDPFEQEARIQEVDPIWGDGTCTLVDEDVAVIPAHNPDGVTTLDQVRISFAADAEEGEAGGAGFYGMTGYEAIGSYASDALAGTEDDSRRLLRRDDVAVVWSDGTPEIESVKIAGTTNWLDTIDLKSARFTIVGYGATGFVSGSVISLYGRNPNTEMAVRRPSVQDRPCDQRL
jgi:hypothetical protein